MSRWSKVVVLVLLLLVSAMALRNLAVTGDVMSAHGGDPVPPTPWLVAHGGDPVPPTPWAHGGDPVPPTPWKQ